VDELSAPQRTDWLRRRAYALMTAAGTRKVRLYDARHACLTYLAVNGVPATIVSAWAGHSDLSLAARVYVHPSAKDLEQGRDALAAWLG
jgi:integrase